MSKYLVVALIAVVICTATAAFGDVLYQNDFGTTEQFNGLAWSNVSGSGLASLRLDPMGSAYDLDGDNQSSIVAEATTWGSSTGSKVIYAPIFTTIGDITVSGYGSGHWSAQASGARWGVGAYSAQTDNNFNMHYKSISTQISPGVWDPDYQGLLSVSAHTSVYSTSGAVPEHAYGRTAAFKVEGTVKNAEVGERVYILNEDFGTQEQRDSWTITNTNLVFDEMSSLDVDGDNVGASVRCATPGNVSLTYQIVAPTGYLFSNAIATGSGSGSKNNWASSTEIRLSTDGTNWDVVSSVPGAVNGWYSMTADTTGVAGFENLSSLYVQVYMTSWSTGYLPQCRGLNITADIVAAPEIPEPGSMLALGSGLVGLVGFAVRRRKQG